MIMEPTNTHTAKTLARLGFAKNTCMRFAKSIDYNLLEGLEITGLREVTYRINKVHDLMETRINERLEPEELVIVKLEELYEQLQNAYETAGEIDKSLHGSLDLKRLCNRARSEAGD